jgi:hypothetical protein
MRSARLALLLLLAAACASAPPAPPPDIHSDLIAMRVADQEVRKRWIADRQNAAIIEEMKAIDAKNVARLREIVRTYGWPVQSRVGREAAGAAWMIAQHSGAEVLHEMLPKMKIAADNGELDKSLYATSVDRVLIQDGKKQLYGTQFDTNDGKCEPLPIEDPQHVEERRLKMGMPMLREYASLLCAPYRKQ